MANADNAFGLRPVSRVDGTAYSGASIEGYWAGHASNTIYVGDAVKLSGTGDDNGVPSFTRADAGDAIWGVCVGILGDANEDLTRDTPRYLGVDAGYLAVVKADEMIFEIQEDSVGGALAKTNIGNKLDLIYGTPNTSHPIRSAGELDSSTAGTVTAQLQIVKFPRRPDNEIGTNAKWHVVVAELQTAGV